MTKPFRRQFVPNAMLGKDPRDLARFKDFGLRLAGVHYTFCLSLLATIRLYVTYTTPPPGGRGPIVH